MEQQKIWRRVRRPRKRSRRAAILSLDPLPAVTPEMARSLLRYGQYLSEWELSFAGNIALASGRSLPRQSLKPTEIWLRVEVQIVKVYAG